jgi:hypothetical protein
LLLVGQLRKLFEHLSFVVALEFVLAWIKNDRLDATPRGQKSLRSTGAKRKGSLLLQKQLTTLTEQTKELGELAQRVTLAAAEPLKTGFTKASGGT